MKKKITISTGVYNEEEVVYDVYKAIKSVFDSQKKYDYEHIFMDNCSTDNTLSILKKIAKKDKRVKILSYSRNFGPEKSGYMAIKYASGDALIPYEGNMKDPAELIHTFIKKWEKGYQLVMGIRTSTKDNPLMGYLRKTFYKLLTLMSEEELPMNYGSYGLIDRKILDVLKGIEDYKPYTRGLIATAGYKRTKVYYERRKRRNKRSKGSSGYLIDFAINAIISYSVSPIRFCTYLGLGLSSLSFVTALIYLILKLFYWKVTIPGVSAAILLILFFSGIQLFFLGVIGEYIAAIHSQVRKKPFVIINEKINFDS